MFGDQTMFDGVWSSNISRLVRSLVSCKTSKFVTITAADYVALRMRFFMKIQD